jgi:hypothetical protein
METDNVLNEKDAVALLRGTLLVAVEQLNDALPVFSAYVRHNAGQLWVEAPECPKHGVLPGSPLHADLLKKVCELLLATEYVNGQSPQTTVRLPSVVVLPKEGLRQAWNINTLREHLDEAWLAIGKKKVKLADQPRPIPLQRYVLRRSFNGRHHQRQSTRFFEPIPGPPRSIGFFWYANAQNQKSDVPKIRKYLEGLEQTSQVREDLASLAQLPADEPLSLQKTTRVEARARITWLDARGEEQEIKKAIPALPFFVLRWPQELGLLKPQPTLEEALERRTQHTNTETENQPLLQTVPVFRYLDPQAELEKRARAEQERLARQAAHSKNPRAGNQRRAGMKRRMQSATL